MAANSIPRRYARSLRARVPVLLLILLFVASSAAARAQGPESRAAEFERMGDFAGAARALEPLARAKANDAALLARVGVLWSGSDHYEAAEEFLSKAVALAPDNREFKLSLGQARHRGQQFQKAREAFQQAAQLGDADGRAANGIGACLFSTGDREAAKPVLEKSAAANARLIGPRHLLGRIALEESNYSEAIRKFKECLQLDPKDADSHFWLGVAHRRSGALDEAVEDFRSAIHCDPMQLGARLNLGQVYILQKKEAEGRAEIDAHGKAVRGSQILTFAMNSLRLEPASPRSQTAVGDALLQLELYSEALLHYREALRSKKVPVGALLGAAAACAGMKEHAAQIQYAQKALAVLSADPRANPEDLKRARELSEMTESRAAK